jgi:hypothetical protein
MSLSLKGSEKWDTGSLGGSEAIWQEKLLSRSLYFLINKQTNLPDSLAFGTPAQTRRSLVAREANSPFNCECGDESRKAESGHGIGTPWSELHGDDDVENENEKTQTRK